MGFEATLHNQVGRSLDGAYHRDADSELLEHSSRRNIADNAGYELHHCGGCLSSAFPTVAIRRLRCQTEILKDRRTIIKLCRFTNIGLRVIAYGVSDRYLGRNIR